MASLMKDAAARSQVLRLVDVLAGLPPAHSKARAASLVREYLSADLRALPVLGRLALRIGASRGLPDVVTSFLANRATQLVARRFIVGAGAHAIERAIGGLERAGRYPSIDLLGEAVLSEDEARTYKRGYEDLLDILGRHPLAGQRTPGDTPALEVSLKLSVLTSQFIPWDPDGTSARVRPVVEELFDAARRRGIGVTVDAEQSTAREVTWRVLRDVLGPDGAFAGWADAGMVVQAYLRDVDEHVAEVARFAAGRAAPMRVRLAKGAYWDYEVITANQRGWPVPVFQDKADTDLACERAVRTLLAAPGVSLCLGSHNLRSHAYAEAVRELMGLPAHAVEH